MEEIKLTTTKRGFPYGTSKDFYKKDCSIQTSSIATEQCIWLGIDNPDPQIMSSDGWKPFDLPDGINLTTRMHLSREQVATLLPILQRFVETGKIKK